MDIKNPYEGEGPGGKFAGWARGQRNPGKIPETKAKDFLQGAQEYNKKLEEVISETLIKGDTV